MKKAITKMFVVLCVALGITCVGCKSLPSNDVMYTTTYAIGVSTGMVANQTKIDDATRNATCEIMGIVQTCVPETNETFQVAWMEKAEKHVADLIKAEKLNEAQGKMVLTVFSLACQGLDYIFEVRYPNAKQYKELVSAAINGFTGGFLTVFKPVNVETCVDCGERGMTFDVNAYNWLMQNRK